MQSTALPAGLAVGCHHGPPRLSFREAPQGCVPGRTVGNTGACGARCSSTSSALVLLRRLGRRPEGSVPSWRSRQSVRDSLPPSSRCGEDGAESSRACAAQVQTEPQASWAAPAPLLVASGRGPVRRPSHGRVADGRDSHPTLGEAHTGTERSLPLPLSPRRGLGGGPSVLTLLWSLTWRQPPTEGVCSRMLPIPGGRGWPWASPQGAGRGLGRRTPCPARWCQQSGHCRFCSEPKREGGSPAGVSPGPRPGLPRAVRASQRGGAQPGPRACRRTARGRRR